MRAAVTETMKERGVFDMTLYICRSVEKRTQICDAGPGSNGRGELISRMATGKTCSSFEAEVKAMRETISLEAA